MELKFGVQLIVAMELSHLENVGYSAISAQGKRRDGDLGPG